jgi:hypothetical protein
MKRLVLLMASPFPLVCGWQTVEQQRSLRMPCATSGYENVALFAACACRGSLLRCLGRHKREEKAHSERGMDIYFGRILMWDATLPHGLGAACDAPDKID